MPRTTQDIRDNADRLTALAEESRARLVARKVRELGTYASTQRTRIRPGPRPSGGSAQQQLRTTVRRDLKNDCQALGRDSLVGRILIKRSQSLLIGDGATVTAMTTSDSFNEQATAMFVAWAEGTAIETLGHPDVRRRHTFWQLCRQVIRAWKTDGDILAVFTERGVQLIESERVRSPRTTGTGGVGGVWNQAAISGVVDGVEIGAWGEDLAYHVSEWAASGQAPTTQTRRINAESAVLLTNPLDENVGLVRGEPGLQAALPRIERLDNYILKTGIAADIATCFGLVITEDNAGATQEGLEAAYGDQPTKSHADEPNEITLEPAMVKYTNRGGTVTQVKPEYPTTNYRDYVMCELMMIGADLGIPPVVSVFDASGMSWSNIKAILSIVMRDHEASQDYLVSAFVRRVRNWKIAEWMRMGLLPIVDDWAECAIAMPRAPVVDFKSQVEGNILAVKENLMTKDAATQDLGTGKASEIAAARAIEAERERALGIAPAMLPGAKSPNEPTPAPAPEKAPESPEQD